MKKLFDTFSQTLVKELNKIFGRVPSRMKSVDGKMEKIWSAFNKVRINTLPEMWKHFSKRISMDVSPIFTQSVNFKVFLKC